MLWLGYQTLREPMFKYECLPCPNTSLRTQVFVELVFLAWAIAAFVVSGISVANSPAVPKSIGLLAQDAVLLIADIVGLGWLASRWRTSSKREDRIVHAEEEVQPLQDASHFVLPDLLEFEPFESPL